MLIWVGGVYSTGPVKTRAGYRTIALPELAIPTLERLTPAEQRHHDRPVFRSIHDNPPRHDQLHKPLAALCKAANVPKLNVHGLRHVHAALVYRSTRDVYAVQARLGHTDVSFTMRQYGYGVSKEQDTTAAVDNLLAGRRRSGVDQQALSEVREQSDVRDPSQGEQGSAVNQVDD